MEIPKLLNVREVAELLGVCPRSVVNYTEPRGPLRPVRIGRAIRYAPESIRQFIDDQLSGKAG